MSYIGNTVQNQSFVPTVDYFSGDGSTTAFTLSHPVGSVYELEVVVNNVQQNPSSAYTVNGSTITFTSAPSSGSNNIYVYYVSPNTQIVQPGQGTVYPSSLSTGGPYWNASGNLGVGTTTPGTKVAAKNAATNTYNATAYLSGRTLDLLTNSTSAGDYSGIRFSDPNGSRESFYGVVQEAGGAPAFVWQNYNAGSYSEKMRIDSSGRVTMPYQPAFEAWLTGSAGNAYHNAAVVFNNVGVNTGSCYNTGNGLFTAPVSGVYEFFCSGMAYNVSVFSGLLYVNGVGLSGGRFMYQDVISGYGGASGRWVVQLSAGDYVNYQSGSGGYYREPSSAYGSFSGQLIG